jgi:hypothetical protein
VLLAAFVARERGSANPVIDPALFRDRRFTGGTAATMAVSVALYAILFAFPQYLQSVLGDDPASAGLRLLPMMGGLLVAGGAAGPAVRAAGTRLAVAVGLAVLAGGLVLLSQVHLRTGYGVVAAGLALAGLGAGASIGAAMDAVMAAAGGGEAGIGASVNSALRNAGGAITVAVGGSVLSAGYLRALGPALTALTALPARDAAVARASVTQAVQLAGRLRSGGPALRAAAGAAFLHGLSSVMLICAAVAVAAIPVSLRCLPGRAVPGDASSRRSPSAPATAAPGRPRRLAVRHHGLRDRIGARLAAAQEERHPRPHPRQRAAAVRRAGIRSHHRRADRRRGGRLAHDVLPLLPGQGRRGPV